MVCLSRNPSTGAHSAVNVTRGWNVNVTVAVGAPVTVDVGTLQ